MNPHQGDISGCDGWSVTHGETVQQETVIAVMASDMQKSPDCLPGSPLPAEEQLILSSHPSCTHGGFHTPKACQVRFMSLQVSISGNRLSLLVLCFHATADGPPEPCWYCLRTQESGSQPETGQQVFVFLFSLLLFRGKD